MATDGSKKRAAKRRKRGQNQGSVLCVNGRWRAVVPSRYSPTGKRQIIYGSIREGTNTSEAIATKLAEFLAGKKGESVASSRETVAGFLESWLRSIALHVRPKTLESYRHAVKTLIVPVIGSVKLQALKPEHVKTMMTRLKANGYALRSVAYARSVLRIALKAAEDEHLVTRNVAERVRAPKVPRAEIQSLTLKDAQKLMAKVAGTPGAALITMILSLGLRIGEALGLRWKDVDLKAKTLQIVQAYQIQEHEDGTREGVFVEVKTTKSRRALKMSDALAKILRDHKRAQAERRLSIGELWQEHGLAFPSNVGTPIHPRNATRTLHSALKKAGLDQVGLHSLRHSAATILLAQGVPLFKVSDILGHSSIRVTSDTYRHYSLEDQKEAAAIMDKMITGK